MAEKLPERRYHYRGRIERGANSQWRHGYSADSADGGILYPWMTRLECQQDAKRSGGKAVFYLDGKPMADR